MADVRHGDPSDAVDPHPVEDHGFYTDLADLGLMEAATASRLSAKLSGIKEARTQLRRDMRNLRHEQADRAYEAQAEDQLALLHEDVGAFTQEKEAWGAVRAEIEREHIDWAHERAHREMARAERLEQLAETPPHAMPPPIALADPAAPTPDVPEPILALVRHVDTIEQRKLEQRQQRAEYETRLTLSNAHRAEEWDTLQRRLAAQHVARRAAATDHHTREISRLKQDALQKLVEIQSLQHAHERLVRKSAEWTDRAVRKECVVKKAVRLADAPSVQHVIAACDGFITQAEQARLSSVLSPAARAAQDVAPPAPTASMSLSPSVPRDPRSPLSHRNPLSPGMRSQALSEPTPSAQSFRGEVVRTASPSLPPIHTQSQIRPQQHLPPATSDLWRVGVTYRSCISLNAAAPPHPAHRPVISPAHPRIPAFDVVVERALSTSTTPDAPLPPAPAWLDSAPVLVCPTSPGVTVSGTVSAVLRGGRCTIDNVIVERAHAQARGEDAPVEVEFTVTVCAVPALTARVTAVYVAQVPRIVVTPSWITFTVPPLPRRVHLGGREYVVPPSGSVLRRGTFMRCLQPLVCCPLGGDFEGTGSPDVWGACLGVEVLTAVKALGRSVEFADAEEKVVAGPGEPQAGRARSKASPSFAVVSTCKLPQTEHEPRDTGGEDFPGLYAGEEESASDAVGFATVVSASARGDEVVLRQTAFVAPGATPTTTAPPTQVLLSGFRVERLAAREGLVVCCGVDTTPEAQRRVVFVVLAGGGGGGAYTVPGVASFPFPSAEAGGTVRHPHEAVHVGFLPQSHRAVVALRNSVYVFADAGGGDSGVQCVPDAVLHSELPITSVCGPTPAGAEEVLFFTADGGAARWPSSGGSSAVHGFACNTAVVAAATAPSGDVILADSAGMVLHWPPAAGARTVPIGTHPAAVAVGAASGAVAVSLCTQRLTVWDVELGQLMCVVDVPGGAGAIAAGVVDAVLLARPTYFTPRLKVYVNVDIAVVVGPADACAAAGSERLGDSGGEERPQGHATLRPWLPPDVPWTAEECANLSDGAIDEVSSSARCMGFLKANNLHPPTPCTDASMRAYIIDFVTSCKLNSTPYVDWWQLAPPPS